MRSYLIETIRAYLTREFSRPHTIGKRYFLLRMLGIVMDSDEARDARAKYNREKTEPGQ